MALYAIDAQGSKLKWRGRLQDRRGRKDPKGFRVPKEIPAHKAREATQEQSGRQESKGIPVPQAREVQRGMAFQPEAAPGKFWSKSLKLTTILNGQTGWLLLL